MSFLYHYGKPLLFALPAETAHELAVFALAHRLVPPAGGADDPILATRAFGLAFPNPIGLAAGFDKDARAMAGALALGFGFVEAGTVTPRPQPGNPKPRLFRLQDDRAVINRLGFNSGGLDRCAARMKEARPTGICGANVGRNKDGTEADFATGIARLAGLADYLVVNISSPNTPGLRDLQRRAALSALLARLRDLRGTTPLLVKVAPDLTAEERADIAEVALTEKVDGLIVGNTTVARPALRSSHRDEAGGLSGAPLFAPSTAVLADFYRLTAGRIALIGCGGVSSGAEAYAKIRAGASLVQLYSALVYGGPGLVAEIKRDLAAALKADGFTSVAAAVGADSR